MNIVFRVDASTRIGTGHVMRCLTLADALHNTGAKVTFICRSLSGNLNEFIEQRGYRVYSLPITFQSSTQGSTNYPHAFSWEQDVKETIAIVRNLAQPIDWLIIDHYAIDKKWENEISPYVQRVMVIDDLADRAHHCHLLLDQNFYSSMSTRYSGLLPETCTQLFGPTYALLRPSFKKERQKLRARQSTIQRILLFFGGSDPTNETLKALKAIESREQELEIHIILGKSNMSKTEVREYCTQWRRTFIYDYVEQIEQLIQQVDLAICAGGTFTWERYCLGLPAIVIAVATNQVELAKELQSLGIDQYLGQSEEVTVSQIQKSLSELLQYPDSLLSRSKTALELVDGAGAARVLNYVREGEKL